MHSTITKLLGRRPFQPFEVRMSNGDVFQVRHPENAFLLKTNVIFGNPDSDDFSFVSLLHVVDVKAIGTSAA